MSFSSSLYWEDRYKSGGSSGSGSFGRLARFKANVINGFVRKNEIETVLELGVGDGNQLSLAKYPNYVGADVSSESISECKKRFGGDTSKRFILLGEEKLPKAELVLSLDVIFHLVEDAVFEKYMFQLFDNATRFVIIYSSNQKDLGDTSEHVKHRLFTDWVTSNRTEWNLIKKIENKFPFNPSEPTTTSFSDFFFFEKTT